MLSQTSEMHFSLESQVRILTGLAPCFVASTLKFQEIVVVHSGVWPGRMRQKSGFQLKYFFSFFFNTEAVLEGIIHGVGEVCLVAGWCLSVYCLCHAFWAGELQVARYLTAMTSSRQQLSLGWPWRERDCASGGIRALIMTQIWPPWTPFWPPASSPQCVRGISPSCNLLENKQSSSRNSTSPRYYSGTTVVKCHHGKPGGHQYKVLDLNKHQQICF